MSWAPLPIHAWLRAARELLSLPVVSSCCFPWKKSSWSKWFRENIGHLMPAWLELAVPVEATRSHWFG